MKNVLCCIGDITSEFQSKIANVISSEARRIGAAVMFCCNSSARDVNALFGAIEMHVVDIPDATRVDGVIVCPDTFGIDGMAEYITDYFQKEASCPIVSIRAFTEGVYNVIGDDYNSQTEMIEHFINEHHFTRIAYMAGRLDLEDGRLRLQAYLDTMKKYGLEVTEGMIYYGDYWRNRGNEAAEWFITKNRDLPQVVVCANDYMAVSLCDAFLHRGYRIPQDICVSGYDDLEEAQFQIPPLTTMHVPHSDMGKAAVHILKNIWEGKPQSETVRMQLSARFRNSCGCERDLNMVSFQRLYRDKENLQRAMHHSTYMNLEFEGSDTLAELMFSVYTYLKGKGLGEMYFCFCDEEERQNNVAEMAGKYTDHMILKAIVNDEGVTMLEERFERKDVLPESYYDYSVPLFLVSLHEKDYCFGYIAFRNLDLSESKYYMKNMIFSLISSLERIRIFEEVKSVSELREQSYIDALTSLPNRRAMEHTMKKLYERLERTGQCFCIVSIDLDGLKYINDTFGHVEGDTALIAFGEVLSHHSHPYGINARIGGDEFLALFPSEDESEALQWEKDVQAEIAEYNERSDKPYKLSASIGFYYCRKGMNMLACMREADKRMYQQKKTKKHARK
ncbi:MAG: GGDEF domain-containing protein [Lachnospiraceae bacterium]|nr:GGDEF domain-containing protein [Lachnospiraceae bacterium]